MSAIDRRKPIFLVLLVSLFLASLACRVEGPRIVLEDEQTPPPTPVVITQVATEIITPTPGIVTPPPQPIPTSAPTLTPTWDPASAPVYYPIEGCPASRLHIGDQAFVSTLGGSNAIRTSPDLHADTNIVYYADPGEVLNIVAGPWCNWGWIIWLVETRDGVRGFTPEGNGDEYFLFPVGP